MLTKIVIKNGRAHASKALLVSAALLILPQIAAAQAPAPMSGEVEFSRGVGFAQAPGQTPRTLGKGLALSEGDRLTTSDAALAVIKLQDGTRMTVRPNTEMVLQQYRFKENAPDNSMVMQLVRGGFRAITGLISKNSPNAARIQTSTATIGIRGTDFDARVCAKDCNLEAKQTRQLARVNAVRASAKVISSRGDVYATDSSGQRRRLVDGGSMYPGDTVETNAAAQAVIAFRDESKLTLAAVSRLRIDNFVFDDKNPKEGRFLMSVLSGSVRAASGLIAKSNAQNASVNTALASISLRGAELSLDCTGACTGLATGGGLALFNWQGLSEVIQTGQSVVQTLQSGQGLLISAAGVQTNNTPPVAALDSPTLTPTPLSLFVNSDVDESEEGLYVFVRDGHIQITTQREILHLGQGEAGFSSNDGLAQRPILIPRFLDFDRVPLPSSNNLVISSILGNSGVRQPNMCR